MGGGCGWAGCKRGWGGSAGGTEGSRALEPRAGRPGAPGHREAQSPPEHAAADPRSHTVAGPLRSKGCAPWGPRRGYGAAGGEVVGMRSTAQSPYCPRCGTVSSGACRTAASALTWPPHALACSAAQVTGRERVVAGWPESHPGGPTASWGRAGPFGGRALPSPAVGTWDMGKTGHPPLPGRNPDPPHQSRASAAAVTFCGCNVGYGRLSGCGDTVWGSSASAGGCGFGGSSGGGGSVSSVCGCGDRKKRSSKWAGPSSLVQGPGCSRCGRLGPWLMNLWENFHKLARFHLREARVHERRAIVIRVQG